MLKDLKSQTSTAGMERALDNLPHGLDAMYIHILQRLVDNMKPDPKELCIRALRWIVGAYRPLQIRELEELLAAGTCDTPNSVFLYSQKDIEDICGSLISIREGTVHLAHLSTSEFLKRTPEELKLPPKSPVAEFLVNPKTASAMLAADCLKYQLQERFCGPLDEPIEPHCGVGWTPYQVEHTCPALQYSAMSWVDHLRDTDPSDLEEPLNLVRRFYVSRNCLTWIEVLISLSDHSKSVLQNNAWSFDKTIHHLEGVSDLRQWARHLMRLGREHAPALSINPNAIHSMDPNDVFTGIWKEETELSAPVRTYPVQRSEISSSLDDENLAEIKFNHYEMTRSDWGKDSENSYLHLNQDRTLAFDIAQTDLGFYDIEILNLKTEQSGSFSLDDGLSDTSMGPKVRYLNTLLHPSEIPDGVGSYLVSAGFSADSKYFYIVFSSYDHSSVARLSLWEIVDFHLIFNVHTADGMNPCKLVFSGSLIDDQSELRAFMPMKYFLLHDLLPKIGCFRPNGEFLSPFGIFHIPSTSLKSWLAPHSIVRITAHRDPGTRYLSLPTSKSHLQVIRKKVRKKAWTYSTN